MSAVGLGETANGRCIVAITPSTATATITAAWKPSSSTCLKVLLRSGLPVEREQGTRKFVRLRREELDARFPGLLASVVQA